MRVSVTTPSAMKQQKSEQEYVVLHVFSDVCNLTDGSGNVLSLVTREDALSPFSMLVTSPEDKDRDGFRFDELIDVNSPVKLSRKRTQVGGIRISAKNARIWNPLIERGAIHSDRVMSYLPMIEEKLRDFALQKSLVELLGKDRLFGIHGLVQSAWLDLRKAMELGDAKAVSRHAVRLAGLGEGLTPAGDDLLIGIICALWILGDEKADETIDAIVRQSIPLTTTLSAAWLHAAGRGEFGILWHRFLEAIESESDSDVIFYTRQLANVGHSSGVDALTGFIATSYLLDGR